ncbi:MAG TPA: YdiU family protein [Candidatus Binatia bacterium]|nr:YdiU family protein [Candidatus Binatia bacterium]
MSSLEQLRFDNSLVRALPADPDMTNQRRQVLGACYSRVQPTPVPRPRTLACSREVMELIGLDPQQCGSELFAAVFGGNRLLAGMQPYAACYGGHQFGAWAGQLGDGRAITLGEVVRDGRRQELQLKGAGPTPYSRTADGRAVMRSSVREFLCSEAMHHLGVPTTRALCLVETGDVVVRDMFYDGHPQGEPGAIVCRVAPTFLRFGNFEIFASRRDVPTLRRLADYAITTHFPELGQPSRQTYLRWFAEVCRRTALMITHWMRVGFVHGVMNTDNMSILGLTIDYGPYGWLEPYDPHWTPNTTDAEGRRYRYANQPGIAVWNLARFAGSLLPLVETPDELESILRACASELERQYRGMLYAKIGLAPADDGDTLAEDLLAVLQLVETDMTIFFRRLADVKSSAESSANEDAGLIAPLRSAYYSPDEISDDVRSATAAWLRRYVDRVRASGIPDEERRRAMNAINPKYVLRNYIAQLAIDKAEQGDGSLVEELLEVLRHPYDEQPGNEEYADKRPEWARHRPGCSMLSCSS